MKRVYDDLHTINTLPDGITPKRRESVTNTVGKTDPGFT